MVNKDCETVCDKLTDINNTLVRTLVDRITELLEDINSSIEAAGRVDKSLIDEIVELKVLVGKLSVAVAGMEEEALINSKTLEKIASDIDIMIKTCSYNEQDKEKVVSFYRRLSGAVASWTDAEKNAVIDTVEGFGGSIISIKRKLKRIYWLLGTAGIASILVSVGAPEWVRAIVKLLLGA